MPSEIPGLHKNAVRFPFLRRLATLYFIIQIFPYPIGSIRYISFISDTYNRLFNHLVVWCGKYVFGLSSFTVTSYNGSGDRLFNYIWLVVMAVLSLIITLIWQIFYKNKERSERIQNWLIAYIQFYFALVMMKYGLEKVIQMQFPFPYTSLNETYGQSSPMKLMWSFMGYSRIYNLILGATEMIAGFLILFRRTVLPGALLGIAIMSNVVVLNLCYDVPVKLFAINFLLMAVFIAAPDMKRLVDFFLNKTVVAKEFTPLLRSKKAMRIFTSIKFVTATVVFAFGMQSVRLNYSSWGNGAFTQTPLFGIYQVEAFIKNKDTLPPLQSDTTRWKELSIIYKKEATIKLMNDSLRMYRMATDTIHQTIEIGKKNPSLNTGTFSYKKIDATHLLLTGKWRSDSLVVMMRKQNMNNYLLINRGFHWINEEPYRR